ncbi:MAG: NADH-quinone oxidoreductase subunit N [Thermoanaerobaculia bacterium]
MSPTEYSIPAADLIGIYPELILTGAGVLILLLDAFFGRRRLTTTILGLAAIAAAAFYGLSTPAGSSFGGLLETTAFSVAIRWVVLVSLGLALLGSHSYLRREKLPPGEYTALLMWAATGAMLMARSAELITLFLNLELLSICLYALAAYHRRLAVATESGIKYFLNGAFISCFVLLGIALVYGETGTTNLETIANSGLDLASPMLVIGLLLLICGFAFKMSVAPFHAWAPDVYQGAASPFVAFLSVAPKAASLVVLVRITELTVVTQIHDWDRVLAVLAVLSMLVGNVLALAQRDLKRMLAYSGVAHMGYLLVPLVGLGDGTREAIFVYLVAYALMNAGAFVAVSRLYSEPGDQHLISDLAGWGYRFPLVGAGLTVCLLSLGGIPPTLGFVGKYLVFLHAIQSGNAPLAVAIVVTSLLGVYYYLRVVYTLYMMPEVRQPEAATRRLDWGAATAVTLGAAGTLLLGLWPTGMIEWFTRALAAVS